MDFYLDTEFHEYQKRLDSDSTVDTIELISIGIVSEDRKFYAICNEFDVDAAWEHDFLRANVLDKIFHELLRLSGGHEDINRYKYDPNLATTKALLQELLAKYGQSKAQITEDLRRFIYLPYLDQSSDVLPQAFEDLTPNVATKLQGNPIRFYAYYADYDWVVFCWLFGRMIDLPPGFPMYCRDLKQIYDEVQETYPQHLVTMDGYPKQSGDVHNALVDALWDQKLHAFLKGM